MVWHKSVFVVLIKPKVIRMQCDMLLGPHDNVTQQIITPQDVTWPMWVTTAGLHVAYQFK